MQEEQDRSAVAELSVVTLIDKIVRRVLGEDNVYEQIGLNTNLFEVGVDSLNVIDVVLAIEDVFKIRIAERDLSANLFERVEHLVTLIERKRLE